MKFNPLMIDIPVKPRTLESLIEKYEYSLAIPATAEMAMAERQSIIYECDAKGFHTDEDMAMIDYLWKVRGAVVDLILSNQLMQNETRRIQDRIRSQLYGMSTEQKERMYEMHSRR
ncbi:Phage protein [Klebsiella phage PMBT1]|uniref:Phage protein n=1 Tax=Klebsiella phage PMBT1 TaxID=1880822 RepID=A0A1G4GQB5_9CAUD|nr:Phage protein [Klebsiella phage PMBT1]SCO64738.1 Phage protein [Klebsiella phage PMBT1]